MGGGCLGHGCPLPSAHYCPLRVLCPTASAVMVLLLPKSSVLIFLYSTVEDSDVAVQVCSQGKFSSAHQPSSANSCSSRLRHLNMSKTDVIPDSAIETCQHQLFPPPSKLSKTAVLPDSAIKTCHAVLSDLASKHVNNS
jgi:hypothetical protein